MGRCAAFLGSRGAALSLATPVVERQIVYLSAASLSLNVMLYLAAFVVLRLIGHSNFGLALTPKIDASWRNSETEIKEVAFQAGSRVRATMLIEMED